MNKTKKISDITTLRRVLKLARPFRFLFASCAFLAVILAPIAIVRPFLINKIVDEYILLKNYQGLLFWIGIIFAVLVFEVILKYLFIYSSRLLGQSVIKDLRVRVYKHILKLRLTYFDKTPIGTNTTRTVNDIETINTIFADGMISIIADVLTLIAVLVAMFVTSWKLTLVSLVTLPLLILATYIFKEKVKKAFQTVRTKISEMNAFLQERISGMHIVQIFSAEQQEADKFQTINKAYLQANLNTIFYYSIFFPVVEMLSAVSLGLLVWYGGGLLFSETITKGAFIVFPLYFGLLFRPVRMLADKFNTLQMGLVAAERVFGLLDNTNYIENSGKKEVVSLKGDVKFDEVTFSYAQDKKELEEEDLILRKVSFSIAEGETLAIVGSTGSGKSTIINVLSRFYEIHSGKVSIGKTNIKDIPLDTLRSRIAVVLQDVFLFSGSVLDNITLRDESITKEAVVNSAKLIGAHDFIMKLPGGYDYEVMERGATLSLGQRQLVSFVRALVFNPDILVLDEATSSIDPESEKIIQYAIEKLIQKRTSIIIAHRLSTIQHANKILVLQKGTVVEYGSHEDLLAIPDGHYRNLHELQFSEKQES